MGRKYSASGSGLLNGTSKTLIGLTSTAAVRPMILTVDIGTVASPADNAANYQIRRFTAAGTAAASPPTGQALDPNDPVAVVVVGLAVYSVEPTYTAGAHLLNISINMRNSYRWVAYPGGELRMPATAANGLGLQSISASTAFNVETCIHFEE